MILSRDGWLKRVREVKDLSATRLREGDAMLAAVRAGRPRSRWPSSRNFGSCLRHAGARRARVDRLRRAGAEAVQLQGRRAGGGGDGCCPTRRRSRRAPWPWRSPRAASACASTSIPTASCRTRSGRRFAKVGDGDEIVGVQAVAAKGALLAVVTVGGRALLCKADEVAELAGPGRGVTVIKVDDGRCRGRLRGRPGRRRRDHHRRDRRRQEDRRRPGPRRGGRAAAARAGPSPSAPRSSRSRRSAAKIDGGDKGGGDDEGGAPTGKKKLLN